MAEALVAVGVEELKVAVDVGVEVGVEQPDLGGWSEIYGADVAGLGDDGDDAFFGSGLVVVGVGGRADF